MPFICFYNYVKILSFNRLLVGAPRGNYTRPIVSQVLNEPGVVYRCSLPGSCVEIEPAVIKDEEIYIRLVGLFATIRKSHSWFGSAMSIERNSGVFTVYTNFEVI